RRQNPRTGGLRFPAWRQASRFLALCFLCLRAKCLIRAESAIEGLLSVNSRRVSLRPRAAFGAHLERSPQPESQALRTSRKRLLVQKSTLVSTPEDSARFQRENPHAHASGMQRTCSGPTPAAMKKLQELASV